jgi:hypothetical protein
MASCSLVDKTTDEHPSPEILAPTATLTRGKILELAAVGGYASQASRLGVVGNGWIDSGYLQGNFEGKSLA